jgi:hypothetical protein
VPNLSNRIVIEVMDAGIYTEAVILPDYVSLHAPSATLNPTGSVSSLGNGCRLRVHRYITNVGAFSIIGTAPDVCWLDVDYMETSSTGADLITVTGTVTVNLRIGKMNRNSVSGAGAALRIPGGNGVHGSVDHIDVGASASHKGVVVSAGSGYGFIRVGFLEGSGIGVEVADTGTADISIGRLATTTAWNTNSSGTLNIIVVRRDNAGSGTGTVNEVKAV